jgi:hypothetical protein
MIDLSQKSAVLVDHGFFIELALRLARDFGTIYYVDPSWETAQTKVDHAITGDGYAGELIRVKEIWDVIDKVDLAVFPDTGHAGMQLFIEKHVQCPVWGSRRADKLEIEKLAFKKLQEKLGMKFAEYDVIDGLDALREYCQDPKNDDRWIKGTPQFRGNKETFRHVNYEESRAHLDEMSLDLGVIGKIMRYLAEKNIESDIEGGMDTYTVDGQHPKIAVSGFEKKDMCYFAAVQKYEDIPKEVTCVAEFLWPELEKRRCRQMFSTEVKITETLDSYLLEPTIRFPSPAGEEQMELYGNISEIIYEGAQGRLIEPEITAKYACEAMIEHTGNKDKGRNLIVPDSVRQWIKLYGTTKIGNRLAIVPGQECIGAVVGVGNSPKEALDHLKDNAAAIEDQPVVIHIPEIAGVLEEIEEFQAKGMFFSDKPLPEPAAVVE